MDRIYAEMNEEKDFTDGTNKRRISSILKTPRTPLCDLGTGNEFTQEYNVEQRQKNPRRVSFAETIRVFPHDPQTFVELNHAEPSNETNQNLLNENEKPEATQYEITGMNTLLHAPIHTLQPMECLDANPSQELNIVDRTLIFSEQNEMDMTSGHTILITHDTEVCQETDKPKKINFESFLSEIKSEKKASQVTETCFSYSSVQMNESNLSQQKTNTEKTHKINLGDFLESLRSTKLFSASSDQIIPSGGAASERSTYSSKQNACSHLQTENCNMPAVFGELDNRQHGETSALFFEKAILSASKQLGCAESMDVITANTERLLPSGTSASSMINQQQDLGKDKSVAHSTVSYTLRTSNYQPGIQQNTNMSPSKINVNNKEANINHNSAVKITNKDILPSQTSFGTITAPSVTSVPILHGDKTNFSEDMEMTKNCTGLIWEVHSKGTDSPVHGLVQKQRNDVFELMDRTNFREIEMDITKNHASMNSYLNSMHHSNLVSKMTTADQQNDHGNMDLNQRVNLSAARNINLNTSQVSKNFKEQVETPLVPYTTSGTTKWTNSAIEDSTINRTIGLSNNAVSLIPEHENVFAPSENMEISKAVGSLRHNSLKPVAFWDIAQQLTSASRKSIIDSGSGNVALPLSEANEMEITKSCTVPVNYNMLRHERTTEESVDKTTNIYNDMDETKPITCIISQHVENSGSQIMQQQKRSGTTNPTKDRTVVFSLNDGNEMDITRSYTVALNHDAVTFAEDRPVLSIVSSNKTILSTLNDDMEITNSVASETLRSISDFLNVPKQNAGTGRKTIESDSDTSVAFPLSANNKLEFRKNLTEAVEKATQEQTSSSEEHININISNHMPVNKSMSFALADKTVMFVHNNDMEITKPISMTSIKNTGFEALQLKNKENGKAILIKSAKEGTDLCLLDENEMEMTRSHTVAVNYELQHAKAAPRKLFLDPANETSLSAHNNYETISKSSSLVPAENTMIMRNHDMEMTKSLSAEIFKNSLKCLAQKRNLNCESTLADPVNIGVFAQQHNEMEITKCHTVSVNHDDVFHNENILQIPVQSNMDAAGFPTIAKNPEENFHKNKNEPEKNTEWEFSSNQTANEPINTNMHAVLFDNKTIEYCQVASQTKQLFPFNEINAFTSYQNGTETTSLHSDTISCGNLQEFKKEMLGKNMEQNHEEKTNYLEFIKKNTVTNKEHNCYLLPAEKQIPSTSRMSKEKTVAFSDDGNMEVTSNYTTRIERIFMSDRNECELHSLGISNVEFSPSIVDCEKKLNIDKTTSEKSIVQTQQSILNTKERQLEPCIAKINNHMKETVSIVDSNKENELIYPIRKSSLASILSDEIALGLNRKKNLLDESKMEKEDLKKLSQSMQFDDITIKATDVLPYGDKTRKKPEWGSFSKDQHNNLKSSPINIILPVEEPVILNKGSSVVSNCPKLQNVEKKPELVLFSCDDKTNLSEELPKLMKPDCSLKLKEDRIESHAMASKAGINTSSTEGIPLSVSLNTDNSKIRIMPLAIFPPKLPNKRKSALSNLEAPAAKLDKNSEIQDSEVSLLTKSSLDKVTQKSGPFYIDEELLPSYAAEMDSNESLCHEDPGKCPDEIHEKMIVNNEMFETNQNLKRPINQENEDIRGEKKFKKDMDWNDITEQRQILHSTEVPHNDIETDENKHIPEVGPTKWEKKQSSKNNLFDSFKVDTSCNIQENSKLETQLLMDSICEQNLQEKLLEGTITVREFFTLLQVHVLIQIPRQSHLPVKHTVNTSSIPEDEILSHCIYHPKLQVYKEDCQTLHMIIEELKIHAADQDKLLVNINKSFWEVMKTCSEEELRGFGAELNKMKSCFTKKSKILAHKAKAKLYVKLVHHTKLQFEQLQSRLAKMDELLKEMDSCLFALEKETATLDDSELDANYAMEEHETKVKHIERELEKYKSQEDNLQRGQSDLSDKKQQIISEINQLQRDVRSCQELTEKYNFSEWVIKEWNDHQAVFTFLYDSIELTVGFKYPLDDATFRNKLYWEIVSLNFETLLDETKAAPTAKLVHKLIFQFIDSQNSWQKKCSTVHELSQMLHDLSLVVNRCQLLGEEIEFLNKWGGKFYLLKTEVNNTNVSLLFSSSTPFAKFEVEVSLSANYPTSPIVFTIQKCTGNLGHDEISVVLSSVPVGTNYLKRMVNQISCYLLQYPSAIPKNKRATVQ